jgi:hypothetical protein
MEKIGWQHPTPWSASIAAFACVKEYSKGQVEIDAGTWLSCEKTPTSPGSMMNVAVLSTCAIEPIGPSGTTAGAVWDE